MMSVVGFAENETAGAGVETIGVVGVIGEDDSRPAVGVISPFVFLTVSCNRSN